MHLDRTAHGIHDTRKFCDQAVAGVLDDPAVMLPDLRIDQLAQMRLEAFVRAFLIGAHEPRVAGNVGGQDCCKTAGRGHGSSNPPCSGLSNAPLYRQPTCRNILPSRVVLISQQAAEPTKSPHRRQAELSEAPPELTGGQQPWQSA